MRKFYRHLVTMAITLLILSCSTHYDKYIKRALHQAGSNRYELEKVLAHYESKGDSLKKEAAYFLIKNMFGYFNYSSSDFEKFNHELFQAIKGRTDNYATSFDIFASAVDSIVRIKGNVTFSNLTPAHDSRNLSAGFLIRNIDSAFEAWKNNPWAKNVGFEDFCSYILPYRADKEPIGIDRDALKSKYTEIALASGNVDDPDTVFRYLLSKHFMKYHRKVMESYPYLFSVDHSEILGIGSCEHTAVYYTMLLRSIGLPAAIDYTPQWGNYNGNHYMPHLILSDAVHRSLLKNNNSNNDLENSRFEISFNSGTFIPQDSLPTGFSIQYNTSKQSPRFIEKQA